MNGKKYSFKKKKISETFFLSNLDASISMGISLEVINVEGTDYLAGKLNLICEGED